MIPGPILEAKHVKGIKNGNFESFDILFNIYGDRIYSFALGFLKSPTLAEDVVQQVFIAVWKNRKNLNEKKSFRGYLFTISYHIILRELKDKNKYLSSSDLVVPFDQMTDSSTIEMIDYQLTRDYFFGIIEKMPARQKEVFLKSREEGLSHKEIASQLKISTKTVENHITKAIAFIRKNVKQDQFSSLLYVALFLMS